jgi:ABC-type multidrug transport system fused ATPase/permease subunit
MRQFPIPSTSSLFYCLKVFSGTDKRILLKWVVFQVALGFLDLAGIIAIGLVGALTVSGISSIEPPTVIFSTLELLKLDKLGAQGQVAIIAIFAAFLFLSKTIISIAISRKIINFLSFRGAEISSDLTSRFLSNPLLTVQEKPSQEILYALTIGVNSLTLGVIGTTVTLAGDLSLLIVLAVGLLVLDPMTASLMLLIFVCLSYLLYLLTNKRALYLGSLNAELNIQSNKKILEVLSSYREFVVRNRRYSYSIEVGKIRKNLATTYAELQFMPSISKYLMESAFILIALSISLLQFLLQDATQAIATLSIFLAAGSRIAPAIMRLQQGLIQVKANMGSSIATIELFETLVGVQPLMEVKDTFDFSHSDFDSSVILKNVSFSYPGNSKLVIDDLSLMIEPGSLVAIVGPSGAGKTTLVDILLGIISPASGEVLISNNTPEESIKKWPGAIAYVPQDVVIMDTTLRENVSLGFPKTAVQLELIFEALRISQMTDFIKSLSQGLDTMVGEGGAKLSGGQRQRLGIARAMYTKPKLLVMDEATSALDGKTEADISDSIQALKGSVTVVIIAHRLSTVRKADQIVYIDNGRIIAQGTFDRVRSQVPDFDMQAKLMGL